MNKKTIEASRPEKTGAHLFAITRTRVGTAADTSGGVASEADDKQTTFHSDRLQRRLARASLAFGSNRSIMVAARENQFLINTVAAEHVLMMSRCPMERTGCRRQGNQFDKQRAHPALPNEGLDEREREREWARELRYGSSC